MQKVGSRHHTRMNKINARQCAMRVYSAILSLVSNFIFRTSRWQGQTLLLRAEFTNPSQSAYWKHIGQSHYWPLPLNTCTWYLPVYKKVSSEINFPSAWYFFKHIIRKAYQREEIIFIDNLFLCNTSNMIKLSVRHAILSVPNYTRVLDMFTYNKMF